jgi:hypothetical protein
LGLENWLIHVEWKALGSDGLVASTDCLWSYYEATLHFDVEEMRRLSAGRDTIRAFVLHELVHIICCGYQQFHRPEQLERMVSHLTLALDRCWRATPPDSPRR